jgi:hypothetical protein
MPAVQKIAVYIEVREKVGMLKNNTYPPLVGRNVDSVFLVKERAAVKDNVPIIRLEESG